MKSMITRQQVKSFLTGPVMSLNTPFLKNGDIDYDSIRTLIDFTIDAGSKTIILTAGDSLCTIITDAEAAEIAKVVVEHTAGRAMVVAADREWATGNEIKFAKYLRKIGCDMLMVLPSDCKSACTIDSLVAHYAAITEHIPVMVVTNFLEFRPLSFSVELIHRLRDEVDGIYAIKDDVDGEFGRRMRLMVHEKWLVLSPGSKRRILAGAIYGCDAYMSTFISFEPKVAQRFWKALSTKDTDAATEIVRNIDMPFWDHLAQSKGSFDAAVHGVLELKGLTKRYRRKPYYSLSDQEMEQLADFLKSKNFL